MERIPHRGSVPTSTHQPETLVGLPTRVGGGWILRLEFGSQTPGRGLVLAALRQPEGASMPQLAGKESRKKPGPAREMRPLLQGVRGEGQSHHRSF